VALSNTDIQIFWHLHKPLWQLSFRNGIIYIFKCCTEQITSSVTLCHACVCNLCSLCSMETSFASKNL
jgi:hypothetical protein